MLEIVPITAIVKQKPKYVRVLCARKNVSWLVHRSLGDDFKGMWTVTHSGSGWALFSELKDLREVKFVIDFLKEHYHLNDIQPSANNPFKKPKISKRFYQDMLDLNKMIKDARTINAYLLRGSDVPKGE